MREEGERWGDGACRLERPLSGAGWTRKCCTLLTSVVEASTSEATSTEAASTEATVATLPSALTLTLARTLARTLALTLAHDGGRRNGERRKHGTAVGERGE